MLYAVEIEPFGPYRQTFTPYVWQEFHTLKECRVFAARVLRLWRAYPNHTIRRVGNEWAPLWYLLENGRKPEFSATSAALRIQPARVRHRNPYNLALMEYRRNA